MSYHEQLIQLILSSPQDLEDMIKFHPKHINLHLHYGRRKSFEHFEIDICIVNENKRAIIEVKSHIGLRNYFLNHQYPKMRKKFPLADIYLMYSNVPNSLNLIDIDYEKIEKLGSGKIEYI